MSAEPLSLAFTGHMVDLPGRSPPRFQPEIVDAARIEIARRIARHKAGARHASKALQVSRAAATSSSMRFAEAPVSIL